MSRLTQAGNNGMKSSDSRGSLDHFSPPPKSVQKTILLSEISQTLKKPSNTKFIKKSNHYLQQDDKRKHQKSQIISLQYD